MKISIFTPDSNLTIVGNTFKIYRDSKVEWREDLHTNEKAVKLLMDKFGIYVPKTYHQFLYEK
ncbi:MAG: hypothetical protein LKE59_11265 [Eubacterium sp.]|jgi:arylamine N-acetyltransferase|nr:hypothetical protein [Eubacterium sp.]MCH4078732.1 hypothetical protein [Eubacterium sp.]